MRERRRLTDEERYALRSGKVRLSGSFTAETSVEKAALTYAKNRKDCKAYVGLEKEDWVKRLENEPIQELLNFYLAKALREEDNEDIED